jgi:ribosomal protein S18 acetylase RimI-like enzyme
MSSAPSRASPGKAGSPRAERAIPSIRLGRPADLDGLVALESRCFSPDDQFPRASWRRLLSTAVPAGTAIVLVIEGAGLAAAIAGLLRRGSGVVRIYSIAVDPACRGQGLAGALMRGLARRARARGRAWMSLEVREGNAAALALYGRYGFAIVERLRRYYGGRADGVRMRAALADVLGRTRR